MTAAIDVSPTTRRLRGAVLVVGGLAGALLVGDGQPLLSERGPGELFRSALAYGALLVLWGLWELRPAARS